MVEENVMKVCGLGHRGMMGSERRKERLQTCSDPSKVSVD